MTDPSTSDSGPDTQTVLDALADPDCRAILAELGEPASASEVSDRCDLPQTTVYRKLEALAEADLVEEGSALRADGHHHTTYERDVGGVLVVLDEDGDGFAVDHVAESEPADRRLAAFWAQISEEL